MTINPIARFAVETTCDVEHGGVVGNAQVVAE